MTLREAVADIYRQVRAPEWAAPNLDGLADALRDLSWLPPGLVLVRVPATGTELAALVQVLIDIEAETAGGPHPVRAIVG